MADILALLLCVSSFVHFVADYIPEWMKQAKSVVCWW
jgi:hypothetical protein